VQDKIRQLLTDVQAGNQRALARAITIVENDLPGADSLLEALQQADKARVIGITGPPGAGKSTLVNTLLDYWVKQQKKVAVIAVDPSSPFNYGALLGDRIRMSAFYNHKDIYIRSLASRGALGGLSAKILEITDLVKAAPFHYIIVETVGVGQSEVEIAGLADCTVVALVPEAGDEVQTLKAGIMEIADIFVVNKADRDTAEALYRNLRIMVHEKAHDGAEIPVIRTVATAGTGIDELAAAIDRQLSRSDTKKKLQLLVEKSWQLIQSRRMKDVDKRSLMQKITGAYGNPGFNLYTFIKTQYPDR